MTTVEMADKESSRNTGDEIPAREAQVHFVLNTLVRDTDGGQYLGQVIP
jgi:hypothetical protein